MSKLPQFQVELVAGSDATWNVTVTLLAGVCGSKAPLFLLVLDGSCILLAERIRFVDGMALKVRCWMPAQLTLADAKMTAAEPF